MEVQLIGDPGQRKRAAKAILDVVAGGDPEDIAGCAEGTMLLQHGLDNFDKQFWLTWRLVPTEAAYKVSASVSRTNVRLWSEQAHALVGAKAESVQEEVRSAIKEAQELVEIIVNAGVEHDTDYARYDPSVSPLVDRYGVLVHVPRPEDGCIPIKVTGPSEAARDAAALLEAGYVKGKFTASVLQLAGQVQGMEETMAGDFENDLKALEEENKVKVHRSPVLLYIIGNTSDAVAHSRHTIREMLQFYYPDCFHIIRGLKKDVVEKLREDPQLRVLTARPDCAVSFDQRAGEAWICGKCHSLVQQRIDAVQKKWDSEHWEYDLPDYGAAMWLLGPRGTGEYLERIQAESGANVKVSPVERKVWAEGPPAKIKQAERLVLEAMRGLQRKKENEENAPLKPKELLSDVPPHMRNVLAKLAELNEKKRIAENKQRILDRELAWQRERGPDALAQEPAQPGGAPAQPGAGPAQPDAVTQNRERSRSRDR